MKKQITEKWEKEKKAVRATQVAFDVGEQVQKVIRQEALNQDLTPSDCIRTILGLQALPKAKRLRLSVSLSESDFITLGERFNIDANDRLAIKHHAAQLLIEYVEKHSDSANIDYDDKRDKQSNKGGNTRGDKS